MKKTTAILLKEDFGVMIKNIRLVNNKSLKEVSKKMGWESEQFLRNIENGLSMPPSKSFSKFCKAIGAPANVMKVKAGIIHMASLK